MIERYKLNSILMSGIVKHLELEATSGVELGWAYDSSDHESMIAHIPTFVPDRSFCPQNQLHASFISVQQEFFFPHCPSFFAVMSFVLN